MTSDEIDDANEQADLTLQELITNRPRPVSPVATGACLQCGAKQETRRWCDADCRDLWEMKQQ